MLCFLKRAALAALIGLGLALVADDIAHTAQPPVNSQQVVIGDPNTPAQQAAVDANGALPAPNFDVTALTLTAVTSSQNGRHHHQPDRHGRRVNLEVGHEQDNECS